MLLRWFVVFLLMVVFLLIVYNQYQAFREYMEGEAKGEEKGEAKGEAKGKAENSSANESTNESTDEMKKKEKLQSISEETLNLTNRIDGIIKKSSLDSTEIANINLQELEETSKNLLMEKEEVSKQNEIQINEVQEKLKKAVEKRAVPEKGVHIEIT